MTGAGAIDLGQTVDRLFDPAARLVGLSAGGGDQVGGEAFLVVEQNLEDVFGGKALVAQTQGQGLRGLDKSAGTLGVVLEFHGQTPMSGSLS